MTKISTLVLVLALAPTAALAKPVDPSRYYKFKIAYTEHANLRAKRLKLASLRQKRLIELQSPRFRKK